MTNAEAQMLMDFAYLASKDTTLRTENAPSLPSTTLSLLTMAVANGTGTTKSASNALMDGFSTAIKFAFLLILIVILTTLLDNVHLVSLAISYPLENVFLPTLSVNLLDLMAHAYPASQVTFCLIILVPQSVSLPVFTYIMLNVALKN